MKINAKLYDGKSSKEHLVVVEFTNDKRLLIKEFGINEPLDNIKISTRLGNTDRVIELKDGIRIKSQENDKIDEILNSLKITKSSIHHLERSWKFALFSIATIVIFITFMLTYGADYSANFLANRLPQSTLDNASKATLKQLDKSLLHKSNLSNDRKVQILKLFNKLTNNDKHYKLHFRSSPKMGPNAFMLPSGDIVLLDELVFLDKDPNLYGVLGVLAHEKGHYIYKHGLKSIIKGTIATAFIAYITGDVSSIITILPTALVSTKYSREFEVQADKYAMSELRRLHIPPKYLANMFKSIQEYSKKRAKKESNIAKFNWLSSHPSTKDRIDFFNKE